MSSRPPLWRSLSFRLQSWHALILALAISGMMVAFYHIESERRLDAIDVQLSNLTREVLPELDRPEDHRPPGPPGGPGRFEDDDFGGPPPGMRRRKEEKWQADDAIDPDLKARSWTVAWDPEGHPLHHRGTGRPDSITWNQGRIPAPFVTIDGHRVMYFRGPRHSLLVTGLPLDGHQEALHRYGWELGGVGITLFLAGIVVGGAITHWSLRPARDIAEAARDIAGSDRSRRIDLRRSTRELHELAVVLNEAFDKLDGEITQRERFTADASHEFRTPLTVILGHSERLLAKPRSEEDYRKGLQVVHQSSLRLKAIVEQMMTLAHLDAEVLDHPQPIDLGDLATETLALLRESCARRDALVKMHIQPSPVCGDAELLTRLIANLLSNALRHNPPGTPLEMRSGNDQGLSWLEIEDHGVGIAPEHQDQLFERFYRVDSSRKALDGESGSGLGLSICLKIAQRHGGDLTVSSAPGQGSLFRLTLPGT
ncbi:signal transduction histidine kinase [Haloferula luteola]|uniref:histidine kinase n=1 Tax=Haloferula luteola TaxID=595692 RepID=A0A840VE53_9BACT|nr:HAMP domain-containing sensor histidine kinase [Haloferula luteola]MBB5353784.1 signal transduction histidine kinase [Haloferula luteola]